MKRDLELIRNILIAVEREDKGSGFGISQKALGFQDVGRVFFNRHVLWMEEAGLLIARVEGADNVQSFEPIRLTWLGCEFLDNIRKDDTWKKVMQKVAEKTITASLGVIVELARLAILAKVQPNG